MGTVSTGSSTVTFENIVTNSFGFTLTIGDTFLVKLSPNGYGGYGFALIIYDYLVSSAPGSYGICSSTTLFKDYYSGGAIHITICPSNKVSQNIKVMYLKSLKQ